MHYSKCFNHVKIKTELELVTKLVIEVSSAVSCLPCTQVHTITQDTIVTGILAYLQGASSLRSPQHLHLSASGNFTRKNYSETSDPIKDTLKKNKPPNKGQAESTRVYTLYKITSEKRGQPLYKGQNGWSRKCPYSLIKMLHCMY